MATIYNSGIYQIVNKANNKRYIGSTTRTFHDRWYQHKYLLERKKHHSKYLQLAWNKYGKENFIFEIIEIIDKKYIYDFASREQQYIDVSRPEYNMSDNAFRPSRQGYFHTEETKLKIKLSNKGKKKSNEARKKMSIAKLGKPGSNTGKLRTIEMKNKFRDIKKHLMLPVDRIEIKTGIVKEYESLGQASLDGFDKTRISNCCNNKRKTHKGYYWIFRSQES